MEKAVGGVAGLISLAAVHWVVAMACISTTAVVPGEKAASRATVYSKSMTACDMMFLRARKATATALLLNVACKSEG
uniref:Predicted protein n=1 Tax=Hordeum vulgare subsp. vulgare TaxID=112509 RepID=F2CZT6_HORVV|nr:predicted protein [Hordeum vulgare subsp. vulgare]